MFLWRAHVLRLWLLFLCIGLLLSFLSTTSAKAADSPITITSQTTTVDFPKAIDFLLSAQDAHGSITQATLFIKYDGGSFAEQHVVKPDTTASTVHLSWHDDLITNHFTPADTQVTYYWIVWDAAGQTLTGSMQNVKVIDSRFNWLHLTQDQVQVNWYNRPGEFGQTLLSQVMATVKQIHTTLRVGLTSPIDVWVYASTDDFHGSLPPDAHEWAGGIAFPRLNQTSIVVEDTSSNHLIRDMPHELTHLIFHQNLSASLVPLWFDEGLAVYNQTYHESEMELRYKDAVAHNQLLKLNTITDDFPNDSDQAYLAYAQSWQLLNHMYTTFGQTRMQSFMQAMHTASKTTTFQDAFKASLGTTVQRMENDWHLSLGLPPTLTPAELQALDQPVTQPIPLSSVSITDSNAPMMTLLSLMLIFLPLMGYLTLFFQQRLALRQAQQAEQMLRNAFLATKLPATPQYYTAPGWKSFDYQSPTSYAQSSDPFSDAPYHDRTVPPPEIQE
ncbi:peptidase MA family metallohydrolase [Tengunoibacter tsumagoiensis]|uniref:Peptidase MA-like domain-containing protein n=1 Tax=Tengunoibacter tsumagoiensis TaxID=2014871 RepID=A0A401ZX09_9CHLR|nr:peptidase MA family metallohydrolase [Tengunoibacter tsumagoiensis]GCE11356.1 hypothetical protein KTT_12150 [Tengunoibacter tsumagoiensis]